jgi:hypothetical protein
MTHDWNMFAPLICYTANPWLDRKHALSPEKVHPFLETKPKPVKPFNRADWLAFKAKIKGERQ